MSDGGAASAVQLARLRTGHAAQVAHLALLRRGADGRAVLWTQAWPESCQPGLKVLSGWRSLDGPVLALTVQQGAAAESLLLFGIDQKGRNGRSCPLGRWDAAEITFGPSGFGTAILINEAWNEQMRRAADVTCRTH